MSREFALGLVPVTGRMAVLAARNYHESTVVGVDFCTEIMIVAIYRLTFGTATVQARVKE